jgi:hypothetical protein
VKLIKADKDKFVFRLGKREKRLLFDILKLYPLIPAAYQRVSKFGKDAAQKASQQLLEEALAAQRKESQKQVLAMLNEPKRFQETESGFRFSLSAPQMEWLLQVLNDIRVGSWINLGSPDTEKGEEIPLTEETAPHLWVMEAAGHFEMSLLDVISGQRRG